MNYVYEKLAEIQQQLKAPKGQFNKFGNYAYRSCEDILTAVKPLLGECSLVISDKVIQVGERYYVEATACLKASEGSAVCATAYAREQEERKGMDASQLTGSTSSYARKYALNGLFAIDDARDADSQEPEKKASATSVKRLEKVVADKGRDMAKLCEYYNVKTSADLTEKNITDAIAMLGG